MTDDGRFKPDSGVKKSCHYQTRIVTPGQIADRSPIYCRDLLGRADQIFAQDVRGVLAVKRLRIEIGHPPVADLISQGAIGKTVDCGGRELLDLLKERAVLVNRPGAQKLLASQRVGSDDV